MSNLFFFVLFIIPDLYFDRDWLIDLLKFLNNMFSRYPDFLVENTDKTRLW